MANRNGKVVIIKKGMKSVAKPLTKAQIKDLAIKQNAERVSPTKSAY
jgi:hypothetical protein